MTKKEAAAKPAEPEITREELVLLVEEVNAVLKPENPIVVGRKDTVHSLTVKIKAECDGNVYEVDFTPDPEDDSVAFFSEDADALLEALGVEVLEGAPGDGVEVAEEQTEPPLEEEKPKKGKAGKEEKALAKAEKPAKKDEKAPAKGKAKEEPKKAEKPAKTGPTKNGERYTRSNALVEALDNGGGTKQEIVKAADELFVKCGGNSNMTVMELQYRFTMPALFELEIVKKDKNGNIKFAK